MREHREFPTFREWLLKTRPFQHIIRPAVMRMTDDELERFRQASYHGALYDLNKATYGCLFAIWQAYEPVVESVYRIIRRALGLIKQGR